MENRVDYQDTHIAEENNEQMEENNEGNQYSHAMKDSNQEVELKESDKTEKGGQAMEECIAIDTKDEVLKGVGVGVADLHLEDDILKNKETINVELGAKIEDDHETIEAKDRDFNEISSNPDSSSVELSKVEGSVLAKDDTIAAS